MIRVIALVLSIAIVVAIIGSIGFIVVKTVGYMVNQKFNIGDAIRWSWQDYKNLIGGIFGGGAKAEDPNYWETTYTVNQYIPVVGCTAL